MKSPSELLAVHGVTPKLYEAIRPYVAALPTTSAKINVNTALLPVLIAVSGSAGAGLRTFIDERAKNPAMSVEDAQKRGALSQDPKSNAAGLVDVRSSFFELQAEILVENSRTTFYSTYQRDGGTIRVLGHSTNTD